MAKKKQIKTSGSPDSRESHASSSYLAPKPSEHEQEQILQSIESYQKTPERLKREYEELKKIHSQEVRQAERISGLERDEYPTPERKYFEYTRVKSPEPREGTISHRTYIQLKKAGKEGISKDEFTGYNLLSDKERQLPKASREKIQRQKVNQRGWGNPWGNIRPLRGKARIDRMTRKIFFSEGGE